MSLFLFLLVGWIRMIFYLDCFSCLPKNTERCQAGHNCPLFFKQFNKVCIPVQWCIKSPTSNWWGDNFFSDCQSNWWVDTMIGCILMRKLWWTKCLVSYPGDFLSLLKWDSTCRYFRRSKILRQLGDLWIRAERLFFFFSCPVRTWIDGFSVRAESEPVLKYENASDSAHVAVK